jgi:5-formyltetrahydrofolate cyclo-ligase
MAGGVASGEDAQAMNPAAAAKASLRRQLQERLRAMTEADREEASASLRAMLGQQAFWQGAKRILGFVPTRFEPNIWPSLVAARMAGTEVYLPRFDEMSGQYRPCRVDDLSRDLRVGPHRVREPDRDCPAWDGKHLDLILVPGLGFSASGGRLGRGMGHYDRLLVMIPGCKCGVAFNQQLISELPLEPHDVRLDYVLTPSRCVPASAPGSDTLGRSL